MLLNQDNPYSRSWKLYSPDSTRNAMLSPSTDAPVTPSAPGAKPTPPHTLFRLWLPAAAFIVIVTSSAFPKLMVSRYRCAAGMLEIE